MNIILSPKAVLKLLLWSVSILLIAHITVITVHLVFEPDHGQWIVRMFDFGSERNLPTFYSAVNLMVSALLLFLIAMKHKSMASSWIPWLGLALIMGFLSIDETVEIHEMFKVPAQAILDVPDSSYYVWIVPYLLAAAAVFLLYFKFLMRLPKRTKFLFILSGSIFILGAAGIEVHGNMEQVRQINNNPFYYLSSTIEELLEMLGVICFIYALIDYATSAFEFLTVTIAPQSSHYRRKFQQPTSPDLNPN